MQLNKSEIDKLDFVERANYKKIGVVSRNEVNKGTAGNDGFL